MPAPLSRDEFEVALRGLSVEYWDKHAFHLRLHAGDSTTAEVRSWVANRWYYQPNLSQKNAAIIANCPLPEVRRRWVERILFQDGSGNGDGGLGDWRALTEAVGLSWKEVVDERHLLPGVRFAVDNYVNFCRNRPWTEATGAALTELFAPALMAERVSVWQMHYPWIDPSGYAYFQHRIPVVSDDSAYTRAGTDPLCDARAAGSGPVGTRIQVRCAVGHARRHHARHRSRSVNVDHDHR